MGSVLQSLSYEQALDEDAARVRRISVSDCPRFMFALGMTGWGRKADFPHSGTPMAIADTTLRRQNDDEMEMRMPFKSHDRAATGA